MFRIDETTKKKKETLERKENHFDSGILWKQEGKMNIKMIVCNFSTQNYKLKNNKLDEGTGIYLLSLYLIFFNFKTLIKKILHTYTIIHTHY
jgi:hypothetical protein